VTVRAIVIFMVLMVVALVPLALSWGRSMRAYGTEAPPTTRVWIEIALATLSFVLLACSLIWNALLGPPYSHMRLGVIYASLILMVLVAIASASEKGRLRVPLTTSAIILALEWAYLAVVNSVV
jgi:hypothetical protein